ncbi:MAG: NADH-quinone oxidoreductase subunit L [Candidatus Latescibacterota bacterium]|jgi:NADH-quinone oxidoreductase subunit L
MLSLLWLVPTLPLAGFAVLAAFGTALPRRVVAWVGAGSVGAAFVAALGVAAGLAAAPARPYTQVLWTWMDVSGLQPRIALHLDPLSLVMLLVVTGVGFLIHVYATEYMRDDPGYARFFAYMNLFVGAMLVLVLADSLPVLYLGWEGVGLCSYLLIGFWSHEPANTRAANKAFIVTRVGDAAMALGLFLLFRQVGTLQLQPLLAAAGRPELSGPVLTTAALLLLAGAVGKSGQIPLQVWLPDAMAGPTPVSALIHAATMVTAGVYLIARMDPVFQAAPGVQLLVAVIGATTLLVAGLSALAQRDIKRVLAYSTISQIGYMFVALGVGAWPAAVFHLATHAFFKALLFMAAGAVIVSLHHEQDIFRMGGLRRRLPLVFWTFLVGAASLSALPLVSSGFYSKDLILWSALSAPQGSPWLWAAGAAGALITALYTFRLVFVVFCGPSAGTVSHRPGRAMSGPMVVLAALATVAGLLELPRTLGHVSLFRDFLAPATDPAPERYSVGVEAAEQLLVVALVGVGVLAAYLLFLRDRDRVRRWTASPWGARIHRLLACGFGFDWLYDRLLVRPFLGLARRAAPDLIGRADQPPAWLGEAGARGLAATQSGRLRWYLVGMAAGAAVTVALAVIL